MSQTTARPAVAPSTAAVAGAPCDEDARPTPQQREIWLASRMSEAASRAYNWTIVLEVHGELDVSHLKAAVESVSVRHEAMRAGFPSPDRLVIHASSVVDLPVVDVTHYGASDREAAAARWLASLTSTAMDLGEPPLIRFQALRLAPDHHRVVALCHHTAIDAWGGRVLVDELAAEYRSIVAGGTAPQLPPAPTWEDHRRRQAALEHSPRTSAAQRYWEGKLRDAPRFTFPLATAESRAGYLGDRLRHELSLDLPPKVKRFAAARSATPFIVFLAAFVELGRRLTGSQDILLATPVANRVLPEDAGLVIHCANLLPLRFELHGARTFDDLVALVREEVLAAQEYAAYPFDRSRSAFGQKRDASYAAPIPTLFDVERVRSAIDFGPGLEVSSAIPPTPRNAHFELMASMIEDGPAHSLDVIFRPDLHPPEDVKRWVGEFERILEAGISEPHRSIGALPGDEPGAPRTTASAPTDPVADARGTGRRLEALFERYAEARPSAPAVRFGDEVVTYGELDRRAGALAGRLLASGVRREDVVALMLERSVDLIVAMLGVLKAGGAYLPLDPHYPEDTLRFTLADSGAELVLTHGATDGATWLGEYRRLNVTDRAPHSAPAVAQGGSLDASDLAYVIYTSGSTGRPKGSLIEHRNVTELLAGTSQVFDLGPDDVWLSAHSAAFDFMVWEVWGALTSGACVIVAPSSAMRDPVALARLVLDSGVTVLSQTPLAFRQFSEADDRLTAGESSALRHVVLGGDRLDPEIVRRWRRARSRDAPRVTNMYGITETTVFVTHENVDPLAPADGRTVIGRPLPGMTVAVLDPELRPVAPGQVGEIAVGGPCVSRGYLNRSDLTAARFVPDPESPGARRYLSGDLARQLDDGRLEYLGRADDQLKVRGFRIEPSEIEHCLRTHPAIRDAAVVVFDGRLVAHVVAGSAAAAPDALREHVASRLPRHLVPSRFEVVAALPMTSNGKVDRRALSGAPVVAAEQAAGEATPALEPEVVAAFAEVLDIADVDPHADFFELGGDSLLATRLIGRVSERLGVEVPLPTLFEAPTPAGLALSVAVLQASAAGARWPG
ncbi:MAG TPA: amino acid adenylation domain-containing protein [Solirubrobacteraceae bacterium]